VHRHFMPQMHWNALRDLQIPPDAKTQIWCNVSHRSFYASSIRPTSA
jgi:hypothetical protein